MYRLVVITFDFYGNNDIAPGVWTSAFPAVRLFRRLYTASWCPNHAPDVVTGEFHGLQVSWRLDTASCKLSLLIAGAVELPPFPSFPPASPFQ